MKIYKHGIPGIGVTGERGLTGKSGNSIYFGDVSSFFTYIGHDELNNVSTDYDDIDYDITYANDELRLDPKYNEGDILYVLTSTASDTSIGYMVEITEDMTTCTLDYFLSHIKYDKPFTISNKILGLNIVNTKDNNLYKANDIYKSGLVRITASNESNDNDTNPISNDSDINTSCYHKFLDIPVMYDVSDYFSKLKIINNGKEFRRNIETTAYNTRTLCELKTGDNNRILDILAKQYKGINITPNGSTNLYIDNLYIRNNNYGNVEATDSIYSPDIKLDKNGHCYTLTVNDYDTSAQAFIINPSMFMTDELNGNINDYERGYTHIYWNYNEHNYNPETNTCYYGANYIKGTGVDDTETKVIEVSTFKDGTYDRNWKDPNYMKINNIYIKLLLINTLTTLTLNDVSNKLNPVVSEEEIEKYKDCSGIIQILEKYVKLPYKYIQNREGVIYKEYNNNASMPRVLIYKGEDSSRNKPIYEPILINSIVDVSNYFDVSFYAGCDYNYINDSSKIYLALTDNDAMQYRHHMIMLWVQAPNGIKYYSNQTNAHYNWNDNTYTITADWDPMVRVSSDNISDVHVSEMNSSVFDVTFNGNLMTIKVNEDNTENKITEIQVYEDTSLLSGFNSPGIYNVSPDIITDPSNYVYDNSILDKLYAGNFDLDVDKESKLYTIKYKVNGEDTEEYNHIATYEREMGGYKEYRTLPKINMHMYNDLESLEKLNNSDNGILCNQFQTFVSIQISDFTKNDWGRYSDYLKNLRLKLNLKWDNEILSLLDGKSSYNITYDLYKSNIDIFNVSAKELTDVNNIKNKESDGSYIFTIDEAENDIFYMRILIETQNPEPLCLTRKLFVNSLLVISDNKTFTLNMTGGKPAGSKEILYQTDELKLAVAPISYIASYCQNTEKLTNIDTYKWFSNNSDIVNIAIKPYRLDDIVDKYKSGFTKNPNWNAIAFKPRYFQDNIQSLSIFTVNVNNMRDIIPSKLYNDEYFSKDTDDVFETYLQLVYNSELFNPELIDDEYSFMFNNKTYLASQYGQYGNNTAVYVKQTLEEMVRSENLLYSMKQWNDEYEQNYHYDSDTPYLGHIETYGNGYQYLPKSADNGQYLANNIMSLYDVKNINNMNIFNTTDKISIVNDINKPDKIDEYTPSELFRSLLYLLKWSYPKYITDNNTDMNIIDMLPIGNANTTTNKIPKEQMPYNLCYNIYPRMMFNDEELYNVVLMLRKPSIVLDGQDLLTVNDTCLHITEIKQLSNPINVMN